MVECREEIVQFLLLFAVNVSVPDQNILCNKSKHTTQSLAQWGTHTLRFAWQATKNCVTQFKSLTCLRRTTLTGRTRVLAGRYKSCALQNPHLSPQHHKLVLDRTRVLAGKEITNTSKNKAQKAWGKSLPRLNREPQNGKCPKFIVTKTRSLPQNGLGGREKLTTIGTK